MDKTSFWWTGLCGICHTGGGPSEFDRDGHKYYDFVTGEFGYEKLGLTAGDVTLDGDYAEINTSNGTLRAAPWDVTGVAEADCMFCHRADRTINSGMNMNWIWRTATLRAKDKLVDSGAGSVPAYAAASTAGQGWFGDLQLSSTVPAGKPPMATTLDIDYQPGVTNGSLVEKTDGLYVADTAITATPRDYACWGCHITPDMKKRGREWFNPDSDVHYRNFNNLDDADTGNDVAAADSAACTYCHPAGMTGLQLNHNIAKGNATLGSVRNDTDYTGFRTCADCHLATSADRDPNAPTPPNTTEHNATHRAILSCEACHVPSKATPADLVVDNSVTGSTVGYKTSDFLSADPLDPTDADKTKWYPSFVRRPDRDGVNRIFPVKLLLSVWWGDWDQNGTPSDLTDDVIKPVPLWRVRQIINGTGGPTIPADNQVNTLAEIYEYITALKGDDSHGVQVAANPVLIKGGKVWHDDGAGSVTSFDYHGTGIKTESSHPFSVNHNVRPGSEALGSTNCQECHGGGSGTGGTPVFDRLILVDPFDTNGNPVYKTVRELLGVDPW
jgi:hypothetical protein